ncbi:lytic transglycosylase domain-containing protein [Senegalia massiliensis]|uniref:Lytic transglycosylase domain-containing protein n=1 Tax=Senegalia massiliensis TaxID=1720316 RepID=A0A845QT77_9CLOT|nr:lytic transglycosylase domain-containing protein [Senegalia massiliensis]NBI05745.1 lytic transglycosylase domain-containing protein [Senegalia massiliensis]
MKKKKIILYLFLILIVLTLFNVKNIGRAIYPLKYKDYIGIYSQTNELEPNLVAAIINVESNFDNEAVSNKNAIGLMQILPETAKWIADINNINEFEEYMLYEPGTNIKLGTCYIRNLIEQFESLDLALAAYNGGSGNVNKWLKDKRYSEDGKKLDSIPFKETEEYVEKVKIQSKIYKFLYNF